KQEIRSFLAHTAGKSTHDSMEFLPMRAEIEYFEFDPNELSVQTGKRLGLSLRQIRMVQNYVAKGGHFYKKEDFKKIYAIGKAEYERLAPYIRIPTQHQSSNAPKRTSEQERRANTNTKEVPSFPKLHIELNSTDSITLQKLYGIGPVFASRIIRFRNSIGGFHHVSQLMDVYGMDNERYEPLRDQVFVDTSLVTKININEADFELLNKHPFISYQQANAIIQYRKQHG